MSIVTAFAAAMHTQAAAMIGEIGLTINGVAITAVPAELVLQKNFEGTGNEYVKSLTIVYRTSLLSYASLHKKLATITSGVHAGTILRVESISPGEAFTTLTLEEATKA